MNDRQGGVWLTGNAFLLAGLMVNDRHGVVRPALGSGVYTICNAAFVTAEVGWVVDGLSLFQSINGGLSWQRHQPADLAAVNTIYFVDSQSGWLGGLAGEIYRTTDGGQTWHRSEAPLKYRIEQIMFVDDLHGWAVGYLHQKRMAALFRSTDGGKTWQALVNSDADAKGNPVSVFFLDAQNGWGIEGWQHNVIRTQDGGESWTIQEVDPKSSWNSIFFVDERHGWIVGKGIAHTSDGGLTWKYQINPETSRMNFNGIRFIDAKRGWAIAYDKVLRTQDGGKTWLALSEDWQRMLPLDSLIKTHQSNRRE